MKVGNKVRVTNACLRDNQEDLEWMIGIANATEARGTIERLIPEQEKPYRVAIKGGLMCNFAADELELIEESHEQAE